MAGDKVTETAAGEVAKTKKVAEIIRLPDCFYIEALTRKIRSAQEPDNPHLVGELLALDRVRPYEPLVKQRSRLRRQCYLLLETIEDASLVSHWREHCLNYIHRPLYALNKLADCKNSRLETAVLFARIRRLNLV